MPDLSIITLTWNSSNDIKLFLESLKNNLNNLDIELIIIDNGSRDNTLEVIKCYEKDFNNLIVIPLSKNMGTTFSRNIGIKLASSNKIVICDSDIVFPENSLSNLLKSFDYIKSNKIGIIHPKLIYADGVFQESARKFPDLLTKVYRLLNLEDLRKKRETIDSVLAQKVCKVEYAISAFWLMDKSVFDEVGYLDEKIFYAPEDVEFCARLWSNGYEIWYYPYVVFIHNAKRLTNKKPISILGLSHFKCLLYFWRKYKLKELRDIIYNQKYNN